MGHFFFGSGLPRLVEDFGGGTGGNFVADMSRRTAAASRSLIDTLGFRCRQKSKNASRSSGVNKTLIRAVSFVAIRQKA